MADVVSTDPADVAGRVLVAVARLHRVLRQQSGVDLTPTKLAHLATIKREGPLTLGELATVERVTPPTVTRVVDELERLGLVRRRADAQDRRVCRVEVTDEGRRQLEWSRTRKTAWLAQRVGDLDSASLAQLAAVVPVLEELSGLGRSQAAPTR